MTEQTAIIIDVPASSGLRQQPTCVIRRPRALLLALLALLFAACNGDDDNIAVGTLEIVEVHVGPMQTARAVQVLVHEGDSVNVGDTLVILAQPTLTATEAQAEARAAAAREAARDVARGARPAEIERAEAELRVAVTEADRTAKDLARLEPIAEAGGISRAQLDAARAAARAAANRRDAAEAALQLLRAGARPERIAAARAESRAAEAGADIVRATVSELILVAPVSGIVTSRNIEPGEVLTPGGSAITLGQPTRPWARIYVSQFVLPSLSVGDTLVARLDGDTTRYVGYVTSIATTAEFTPRVALTEDEREDLLFGVRVDFDNASGRLKAGLPVTVQLPRRSQ